MFLIYTTKFADFYGKIVFSQYWQICNWDRGKGVFEEWSEYKKGETSMIWSHLIGQDITILNDMSVFYPLIIWVLYVVDLVMNIKITMQLSR